MAFDLPLRIMCIASMQAMRGSRSAWVDGAFVSLMPNAADSPEKLKHLGAVC